MTMVKLFNILKDGSEEIMRLTGQWASSSLFSLIETEIRFATEEIAKLVGDDIMSAAENEYQTGGSSGLADAIRLPIACLAIMRQSSLSSISHGKDGRKVIIDDNERSPFEWQIDRDDRAMKERYYRALDSMYLFLDKNGGETWNESHTKEIVSESIVKDMTQFESVYPIDGNYYVFYMLQPLVVEKQRSLIAPFAGNRWEEIASCSASEKVMRLARRAAILSAVATAGTRWTLEVFPLEIARRFSPTYQGNRANRAATIEEIDWYLGNLKEEIDDAMEDLGEELSESKVEPKLIPQNDRRNKFFTTE